MTENKSLYDLGLEYETAAATVKSRIDAKTKQLNALPDSICSNEAYVLKSELNTLYSEYRQARDTAEYLKKYYSPEGLVSWGGVFF
ncbi:MAG: hypothetical protein J6R20_00690 [Clostridia bacterium]|nr:hypothetical protein [Clostridia bacterium]